jgi:hypothetical protein
VICYYLLFDSYPTLDPKNNLVFPFNRSISIDMKKKLSNCLAFDQLKRVNWEPKKPSSDKL